MKTLLSTLACAALAVACSSKSPTGTGTSGGVASAAGTTGGATSTSSAGSTGSGSGTSGGTGTSTGGTSGTDGGACATVDGGLVVDGGGSSELGPCGSTADCDCPLTCQLDPTQAVTDPKNPNYPMSGRVCVVACTSTADCANPSTTCQSGFCLTSVCAGDAGPFFGHCNAVTDAGDGICLPTTNASGDAIGNCAPAGSAPLAGACDPGGSRGSPASSLCQPGTLCIPQSDGGGVPDGGPVGECQTACDALVPGGCGTGKVCSSLMDNANYSGSSSPHSGLCFAGGTNGCAIGLGAVDLQSCSNTASCSCPQTCMYDPGQGSSFCETACTTTASDCPQPSTACVNGYCGTNYCDMTPAGDAGPGVYNAACNAAGTNDGTCELQYGFLQQAFGLPIYGICVQSGTADAGSPCDPTALRDGGQELCTAGAACLNFDAGPVLDAGVNLCSNFCDPTSTAGCGNAALGCYPEAPGLAYQSDGLCYTCNATGNNCGVSSECCSRHCADAGAATGYTCQ